MVICLERGADLHMAQLMPLPLSLALVNSRCILPFRYWLTWVLPEKRPLNVCVCVVTSVKNYMWSLDNTHTHTHLIAICPGLPGWAGTRKVKPIWILLKQETVSGSGISWAVCKSATRFRQITMPAPHHSVFYRPDALPATQPTASKHWRYGY